MACGCKKRKEPVVVSDSQSQVIEIPKIEMVPETKPLEEDWYNNIDEIKPIEDNG